MTRSSYSARALFICCSFCLIRRSVVADYGDTVDLNCCQNGVGPCISFEISPGGHRILSAYIHRGARMTVHLHSFGYSSNFQVFIKSNEVPGEQNYDFKLSRNDPGFAQWTCKGVLLYWRVQLADANAKAKFGVTITQDTCLHKDYTQQCPVGWVPNVEGWCKPPKTYTGPCRRQNFFGQRELGHEYSNPASKVYKLLWSERCGATWPCVEHIGHQCMLELNYLERGKWGHSACKGGEVCKVFSLGPMGETGDWRLLMISVPAVSDDFFLWTLSCGSSLGVEIMPVLTSGSVARFRDQNLDSSLGGVAGKEVFTLAVRDGSESVESVDMSKWKWTQSFQGRAPYVQLHNSDCTQWSKYYLGVFSENARSAQVGVVLSHRQLTNLKCE